MSGAQRYYIPLALLIGGLLFWIAPPPGWLLIAAGLGLARVPTGWRAVYLTAAALSALILVWYLSPGEQWTVEYLGYHLQLVQVNAMNQLLALVFALALAAGLLYAYPVANTLELSAALVYAGAALGAVLAGDWLSLFIHWELMALASTLVICAAGTGAYPAALRYLLLHLLGGVLLLAGICALAADGQALTIKALTLNHPAAYLLFAGIVVNVAAPPFWAWVGDAYPAASPSGTVFLSAFTTKTAVLVLWQAFPGSGLLLPLGAAMIIYGIVQALGSGQLRQILVYSLVGQVGYMLIAISVGSPLALKAALALACAHVLYKALLLMCAASIRQVTGTERLEHLGGLWRQLPYTALCMLIGALSIAAVPGTSGFMAKALFSNTLHESGYDLVYYLLSVASVLLPVYLAVRLPYWVLFAAPREAWRVQLQEVSWLQRAAQLGLALLCLMPSALYALLPVAQWPDELYSVAAVVKQLILLALGAGIFWAVRFWTLGRITGPWPDFDQLYRHWGWQGLLWFTESCSVWRTRLEQRSLAIWLWMVNWLFRHHGPEGRLAVTWPSGSMVLWVAILLVCCLLFYFH